MSKKPKYKCPNCGSQSLWVHISIAAKQKLNGTRVYDYQPWIVDNFFDGDCGCEKCKWIGGMDDLICVS